VFCTCLVVGMGAAAPILGGYGHRTQAPYSAVISSASSSGTARTGSFM